MGQSKKIIFLPCKDAYHSNSVIFLPLSMVFKFFIDFFLFFFAYLIIETTVYYVFRKITCELAICPFLFGMGGKIIRIEGDCDALSTCMRERARYCVHVRDGRRGHTRGWQGKTDKQRLLQVDLKTCKSGIFIFQLWSVYFVRLWNLF